jgi:23S rRNA pseudouridine2605 synthase
MSNTSSTQKLQKVLATHGLGSRRAMETWITEGRISVNGEVASIGCRVDDAAVICVDGKELPSLISSSKDVEILMYHKPIGEICTRSDPENRPTVFDDLPPPTSGRWIIVGRLDINTSGLLLFTNSGEYAHLLMHPSHHLEREYEVRVYGEVTPEKLARLRKGVMLEDGMAHFDQLTPLPADTTRNFWFRVTVTQGRNRIVRRLWASQDLQVNRLSRIRFGHLVMPDKLGVGECCVVPLSAAIPHLVSP